MPEKPLGKSSATPEMTPEEAEEAAEVAVATSSDASFATYSPIAIDKEAVDNPPPGPQVEQSRGKPTEGGGTTFSANRGNR